MRFLKILGCAVCMIALLLTNVYAVESYKNVENYTETLERLLSENGSKIYSIKLESDWISGNNGFTEAGPIVISGGKTLNIDLNGYIIDRNLAKTKDDGCIFIVNGGSTLNITDSNPQNRHTDITVSGGIIKGGANTESGGAIVLSEGSKLNISGGNFIGCISNTDAGAIMVSGSSTVNIDSAGFYTNRIYDSNTECYGGAIKVSDSTLNVTNSSFIGNYSEDDGGAIYIDDSDVIIEKCCFTENLAKENGGAVYSDSDSQVTISDSSFDGNIAYESGGAAYINDSESTYFKSNTMTGNNADEFGGAVCVNTDKVFISGGTYTENAAEKCGGGIYVDSLYDLNIQGKLIVRNNTVKGENNNLFLQNGSASDAYIVCGGLYDGSEIYLSVTDDKATVCKDISFYQFSSYLKADKGILKMNNKKVVNEKFVGSAIGKGKLAAVGGLIILLTALVVIVICKKKSGEVKQ